MFGTLKPGETDHADSLVFVERTARLQRTAKGAARAACDLCRERKIKCTGQKSGCDRCKAQNLSCNYSTQGEPSQSGARRQQKPRRETLTNRPTANERMQSYNSISSDSSSGSEILPPHFADISRGSSIPPFYAPYPKHTDDFNPGMPPDDMLADGSNFDAFGLNEHVEYDFHAGSDRMSIHTPSMTPLSTHRGMHSVYQTEYEEGISPSALDSAATINVISETAQDLAALQQSLNKSLSHMTQGAGANFDPSRAFAPDPANRRNSKSRNRSHVLSHEAQLGNSPAAGGSSSASSVGRSHSSRSNSVHHQADRSMSYAAMSGIPQTSPGPCGCTLQAVTLLQEVFEQTAAPLEHIMLHPLKRSIRHFVRISSCAQCLKLPSFVVLLVMISEQISKLFAVVSEQPAFHGGSWQLDVCEVDCAEEQAAVVAALLHCHMNKFREVLRRLVHCTDAPQWANHATGLKAVEQKVSELQRNLRQQLGC